MAAVERERRVSIEALVAEWGEDEKLTLGRALNRLNVSLLENGRTTKEMD
jgi:hypothetical protein